MDMNNIMKVTSLDFLFWAQIHSMKSTCLNYRY